jgi:hypothetical protein
LQRNLCLSAATPLLTACPEPHFLHIGIVPYPSFLMGAFCQKYEGITQRMFQFLKTLAPQSIQGVKSFVSQHRREKNT